MFKVLLQQCIINKVKWAARAWHYRHLILRALRHSPKTAVYVMRAVGPTPVRIFDGRCARWQPVLFKARCVREISVSPFLQICPTWRQSLELPREGTRVALLRCQITLRHSGTYVQACASCGVRQKTRWHPCRAVLDASTTVRTVRTLGNPIPSAAAVA